MEIENKIHEKYQNAVPLTELVETITQHLNNNNIEINHCVPATCLCRDDSTSQIIQELKKNNFKNNFNLEALGGAPLAGKTALTAYYHHLHNENQTNYSGLIIFGPHIGIDKNLKFGHLHREGQDRPSTSCGANHIILNHIQQNTQPDSNDPELLNLYNYLKPYFNQIKDLEEKTDQIQKIVEKEYEKGIQDLIETITQLKQNEANNHKILLIGGIHIDTPPELQNHFEIKQITWL